MKKILATFLALFLIFSISSADVGTNKNIRVNRSVSDEILERGEVDYFNFSISDPGSIQIRFEFDVEDSYTVKLINAETGKTVQSVNFSSDVNTVSGVYEKLGNKIRVSEGDYQVQVSTSYFSEDNEEYELEVIYDEEDSDRYEKESNNDAKTAMLIDYNKSVTGNLESSNDVDYYMVEIPSHGELYTELKFDAEACYNIEVFTEENGSLKSLQSNRFEAKLSQNSDMYFDNSEMLRVPSGNYYFKISRAWSNYSNLDYVFSVRYSGNQYGNYEIESNNEPRSATEIGANIEVIGNLSTKSDVDYYRVNIWDANKLTVKMNIPEDAAYNVTTYKDVNGELSEIASERLVSKELFGVVSGKTQEISVGDYYFKVTSRSYSNLDYTFLVETNNYYNESNNNIYNDAKKTNIVLEIGNPYMTVNGVNYPIDGNRGTSPVILNSRTLLPIRAVIEHLGGSVTWIDAARGININLDGKNIYLTLDSALSYVNGVEKWLDVAPTSINGRTMIPVKFVMDNLGGSVIWNATTGTVTITYVIGK